VRSSYPYVNVVDLYVRDLGETCNNCSGQELHLCCPGRVIYFDKQNRLVQSNWPNVSRNVLSDSISPPTKNAADLFPIGAPQ
jgi:hypothetical protein